MQPDRERSFCRPIPAIKNRRNEHRRGQFSVLPARPQLGRQHRLLLLNRQLVRSF